MTQFIEKILPYFLLAFLLSGGVFFISGIGDKFGYPHFSEVSVIEKNLESLTEGNRRLGQCEDEGLRMSVSIYLADITDPNVAGFYSNLGAIVLEETSLTTIAHEVSHYTDWAINKAKITDGETRAYIQGYFTDCAYKLVKYFENEPYQFTSVLSNSDKNIEHWMYMSKEACNLEDSTGDGYKFICSPETYKNLGGKFKQR